MATYRLLARIVELSPGEHCVTVSAIPTDMRSAEVRQDVCKTRGEAEARRDYLVMSLATEIRAQGGEILGRIKQGTLIGMTGWALGNPTLARNIVTALSGQNT